MDGAGTSGTPGGRAVVLSDDLYRALQERIRGSGFAHVEDFVQFVLARLVEDGAQAGEPFTQADEERIAQRLRALGYLD